MALARPLLSVRLRSRQAVRQDVMGVLARLMEVQVMSDTYKTIVKGSYEDLDREVNLYLEDGYVLAQPMFVVNGEQVVQVMVKHGDSMIMNRYM